MGVDADSPVGTGVALTQQGEPMASGLVSDGKVYRCGIYMTANQQQIQTGFHLRDTGLNTEAAADVVASVLDFVNDSFRTIQASGVRFDRVDAVNLHTKEFAQTELTGVIGTGSGVLGTTGMAALVSLRSAKRQRWLNGRMFWPLTPADPLVDGLIKNTVLTTLNTVVADFTDRYVGSAFTSTFKAVVVTAPRAASPTRPALEHSWTDVEVVKVNPIATVQRRRLIGRGS